MTGRKQVKQAAIPFLGPKEQMDIILVNLVENKATPWVTWQMRIEDGLTLSGHYHTTYTQAEAEFKARCGAVNAVEYDGCGERPKV